MPDDMHLHDKLQACLDVGFDSCEICIDLDPGRRARLDWGTSQRTQLSRFIEGKNLRIPTLSLSALRGCPLGALDEEANKQALDMLDKALVFGRNLGAGILLINGYDVYDTPSTPETRERFSQNILRAVELAETHEIILAMENAEKEFADTVEKVAYWVDRVQSPYFKVYCDPANAYNAYPGDGDKVYADIQTAKGHIVAAHLKDSVPGEYRMTPYGEGQVDFARFIPVLMEEGICQYTAELFYRDDRDWRAYAGWVGEFLRGFF